MKQRSDHESTLLKVSRELTSSSARSFHIDDNARNSIRRRMGFLQRYRFDAALRDFDDASQTENIDGHVHYTNVDAVNAALQRLAKVLKRK